MAERRPRDLPAWQRHRRNSAESSPGTHLRHAVSSARGPGRPASHDHGRSRAAKGHHRPGDRHCKQPEARPQAAHGTRDRSQGRGEDGCVLRAHGAAAGRLITASGSVSYPMSIADARVYDAQRYDPFASSMAGSCWPGRPQWQDRAGRGGRSAAANAGLSPDDD